jgi:diaminopimelate epimerase
MLRFGREFYKMSGSGNDFVVFDTRTEAAGDLAHPDRMRAICVRGTGVGADGVVFLEPSTRAHLRMRYFNSDGSLASLCGNAALCVTRLAAELGAGPAFGMVLETDAGLIQARLRADAPEIDLQPVTQVSPDFDAGLALGESRIGFALAGVPHLVIQCADTELVDVGSRGRQLRHHPALPEGANVNFVSPREDGWAMRTFERGVEGETLACGTGAVASAILLWCWGHSGPEVRLRTRSDRELTVRLTKTGASWQPSLSGEGRVVFRGCLGDDQP